MNAKTMILPMLAALTAQDVRADADEEEELQFCRLDWNLAEIPALVAGDCFYTEAGGRDWTCELLVDAEMNASLRLLAVSPSPAGELVLPSSLVGVPVSSVGAGLFDGCEDVERIVFPGTVPDGLAACELPVGVTALVCPAAERAAFEAVSAVTVETAEPSESAVVGGCERLAGLSPDEWFLVEENGRGWCCRTVPCLEETDALEILAVTPMEGTSLEIPDRLGGHPVRQIGEGAFLNWTALTAVLVPDTVALIREQAFGGCTGLRTVAFMGWVPDGAESSGLFGAAAADRLYYCPEICRTDTAAFVDESRIVGPYVEWHYADLSDDAVSFNGRTLGLTGIFSVPAEHDGKRVTAVGARAFDGCAGLTELVLPETVTSVGADAFAGIASALVVFTGAPPDGLAVSGIRSSAFRVRYPAEHADAYRALLGDEPSFAGYYWNQEMRAQTAVENQTWTYRVWSVAADCLSAEVEILGVEPAPKERLEVPTTLDGAVVTAVGDGAFEGCAGLTAVRLPVGLRRIGDRAFAATGIGYLSVPSGVTSLGREILADCDGAVCAFEGGCPAEATGESFGGLSLVLAAADRLDAFAAVVPADVPLQADCNWVVEESPTIYGGLSIVGVTGAVPPIVVVPNARAGEWVITLENDVFTGCETITRVMVAEGVMSIGGWAFADCSNLVDLELAESVFSIFAGAFAGTGLRSFRWDSHLGDVRSGAFADCPDLKRLTLAYPVDAWTLSDIGFAGEVETLVFADTCEAMPGPLLAEFPAKTFVFEGPLPYGFEFGGLERSTAEIRYPHVCRDDYAALVPSERFAGYQWRLGEQFVAVGSDGLTWSCEVEAVSADGSDAGLAISQPDPAPTGMHAFPAAFDGARVTTLDPHVPNPTDGLEAAIVPPNVLRLAPNAFAGYRGLTRVVLPPTLREVGPDAFAGTGVRQLRLPESIETIGDVALSDGSILVFEGPVPEGISRLSRFKVAVYCQSEYASDFAAAVPEGCFAGAEPDWTFALSDDGETVVVTGMGTGEHADRVVLPDVLGGRLVSGLAPAAFAGCVSLDRVLFTSGTPPAGLAESQLLSVAREVEIDASVESLAPGFFSGCTAEVVSFLGAVPAGLADSGLAETACGVRYPLSLAADYAAAVPANRVAGYCWEPDLALTHVDEEGRAWRCRVLSASADGRTARLMIEGVSPEVAGDLVLPDDFLGGTVAMLADELFFENENLTSFVGGAGLEAIGRLTFFGCASLASVTLPDALEYIDDEAFFGCSSLAELELGNGVRTLGAFAFEDCSRLAEVRLPESLVAIGDGAFLNDGLETVVLPASLETLGLYAFRGNDGCELMFRGPLPAIEDFGLAFDSVVRVWAQGENEAAFREALPEGVAFGRDYAWTAIPNHDAEDTVTIYGLEDELTGEVKVPPFVGGRRVKGVGTMAFMFRDAITALEIGDGIEEIGDEAFRYCKSLVRVKLPGSLRRCGFNAFGNCPRLEELEYGEGVETVSAGGLGECEALCRVILPSTVRVIDFSAFSGCPRLAEINFPGSLEEIRSFAFEGTQVTNVNLAGTALRQIGTGAFKDCTALEEVRLEDSFWRYGCEIGREAFAGCTSLATFALPGNPGTLGKDAFAGCTSLARVEFTSTVLPEGVSDSKLLANAVDVYAPLTLADEVMAAMRKGSVFHDAHFAAGPVTLASGVTFVSDRLAELEVRVPAGREYYDVVREAGAARLKLTARALPTRFSLTTNQFGIRFLQLEGTHDDLDYRIEWTPTLSDPVWKTHQVLHGAANKTKLSGFLPDTDSPSQFFRFIVTEQ